MKKWIIYGIAVVFIGFLCWKTNLLNDFVSMIENYHTHSLAERRAIAAKKQTGPILIGAVGAWDITNSNDVWEGINFAAETLNAKGGILNRQVKLLKYNNNARVRDGELIAKELANNLNVDVVIGYFLSEIAIKSSVILQNKGVLTMSSKSLNPMLTERPGYPLVFRCCPSSIDYADKLVNFLKKNNIENVIIYGEDDLYAKTGISNRFETAAFANSLHIVDRQTFYKTYNKNYVAKQLREWRDFYKFDAIFFDGAPETIPKVIKLARQEGIKGLILGYDNMDCDMFIDSLDQDPGNIVVCSAYNPQSTRPVVKEFIKNYHMKYGKNPSMYAAYGYDTLMSIAAAITQANSTVPGKIADALREIKYDGVTVSPLSFNDQGELKKSGVLLKMLDWKSKSFVVIDDAPTPGILKPIETAPSSPDAPLPLPPGGKTIQTFSPGKTATKPILKH